MAVKTAKKKTADKGRTSKTTAKKSVAKTKAATGARKRTPAAAKTKKKAVFVKKKTAAAAKKKTAARPGKRPGAVKKPRSKKKVSFNREMTKRLTAAKRMLLSEVSHKIKSESDSSKPEIGDIYDIASSERERELALTLGDREREKLIEIEQALDRLKDKSYSACEECGEPIGEERLRAMPFTCVCVECKSKLEREHLVKGKFLEESATGTFDRSGSNDDDF